MPLEFHDMSNEQTGGKLKLAIVGHEKNGKSWLASTGRKNVLFHGFDQRSEALSGKQGVYEISYIDPQWPKQPESAQNFLTTLGKLEESLDLAKLGFKVPEGTLVRTNVIDSIQTFGKAFQNYALYNSKDIRRELTIGSMKVFLPGGWDAWNAEMVPVENAILRLLALPTDTIIVLHETAEETADSTSEKPRFTGRVGVFPVRYQRLIKYFNEVWRVKLTQTTVNNKSLYVPRVYPLPNYEFDCATAMHLDAVEEPNIQAMIAKSEQRQLASGRPSNTAIAGRAHPELQGDSLKNQPKQLKL
jgi:AAA domain